jgi:hypothetical protein
LNNINLNIDQLPNSDDLKIPPSALFTGKKTFPDDNNNPAVENVGYSGPSNFNNENHNLDHSQASLRRNLSAAMKPPEIVVPANNQNRIVNNQSRSNSNNRRNEDCCNRNKFFGIIYIIFIFAFVIMIILFPILLTLPSEGDLYSNFSTLASKTVSSYYTLDFPGDFSFLSNFEVTCNKNSYLLGFNLQKYSSSIDKFYLVKYCRTASQELSVSNFYTEEVPYNDQVDENNIYLDKLQVLCNKQSFLTGFFLKLSGSKMYYKYSCADSQKVLNGCSSTQTSKIKIDLSNQNKIPGDIIKFSIISFLANLKFSVNEQNQVLQGFKLDSEKLIDGNINLYYTYYYCYFPSTITRAVKSDNGSIKALTGLDVNCGTNHALKGFFLTQPSSSTINYNYNCEWVGSNEISIKNTPKNDIQLNNNYYASTNYLDRHNVACDNGWAIQKFILKTEESISNYKIFYNYICVKVNVKNCFTSETPVKDGASRSENVARATYLTAQKIDLKPRQILQQFQLKTSYGAYSFPYYSYRYTYCDLN